MRSVSSVAHRAARQLRPSTASAMYSMNRALAQGPKVSWSTSVFFRLRGEGDGKSRERASEQAGPWRAGRCRSGMRCSSPGP